MPDEIVKSLCNRCRQKTDHDVVWKDTTTVEYPDSVTETRTLVVCCRGCKECAVREEQWYFDYIPDENSGGQLFRTTYKPPRLWRHPPQWLGSLEEIDADLKGLLDEVYLATNDQQIRLLAMGVRSVLDHVMTLILGGDIGEFGQKLKAMVEKNHLTEKQAENISIVIDAGSASTHRGFKPPHDLVEEMVVVMENIVREHYITGPMLKTAKKMIPPRPPRQAKANNPGGWRST